MGKWGKRRWEIEFRLYRDDETYWVHGYQIAEHWFKCFAVQIAKKKVWWGDGQIEILNVEELK